MNLDTLNGHGRNGNENRIRSNCEKVSAGSEGKAHLVIKTSQKPADGSTSGRAEADSKNASGCETDVSEQMEVAAFCKYYCKNNRHYVFYDEMIEGTDQITSNRIIMTKDRMELVRKGAVNTVMSFEEGRIIREKYHTQYGIMEMGVDTQRLSVMEKEDGIEAEADYMLEINGDYVSSNKMWLRISMRK